MDPWDRVFNDLSDNKAIGGPPYKVLLTCEECNYPHHLERPRWRDEKITLICHGCETPISSMFALPR